MCFTWQSGRHVARNLGRGPMLPSQVPSCGSSLAYLVGGQQGSPVAGNFRTVGMLGHQHRPRERKGRGGWVGQTQWPILYAFPSLARHLQISFEPSCTPASRRGVPCPLWMSFSSVARSIAAPPRVGGFVCRLDLGWPGWAVLVVECLSSPRYGCSQLGRKTMASSVVIRASVIGGIRCWAHKTMPPATHLPPPLIVLGNF